MLALLAIPMVLLALTSTTVAAQESNGCVDIAKNGDSSIIDLQFRPLGFGFPGFTATPLLSRFGFALQEGRDNHLQQILVYPVLSAGMIRLDFSDKEPDNQFPLPNDDYCYNVSHFGIVDARIRHVDRGLDICEASKCTVRLDKPAGDFVFVLIGFQLSFRGDDNRLKEVAMLENNGELTVAYNDKEFDPAQDTFLWSIQYAYVPGELLNVGELSGVGANDRVLATMPAGRAMLRGFRLNFAVADQRIQQISVRPNGTGTAFIVYRDVDGEDKFDWEYRWAILRTVGHSLGDKIDPIRP